MMASALFLAACAQAARPVAPRDTSSPGAVTTAEPPGEFDPSRYHFTGTPPRGQAAPPLVPPAQAACTFSAVDWSGALRLDAGGEVFAEVSSANQVTVLVPGGDASQGAFVEVHAPGLLLKGRVVASDVALGFRRSTLLGGYVWTHSANALTWKRASAKGVELELDVGPRVRPLRGLPTTKRTCEELTLEVESAGAFDPRVALGRGQPLREAEWVGHENVPLSLSPAGSPIAELDTRPERDDAESDTDDVEPESDDVERERALVIEVRRGSWRVLYALENVVVMGWVPASALERETVEEVELLDLSVPSAPWSPTSPFGGDDPTRGAASSEPESPRRCAWNALLTVELGGEKRQVGAIASGIPLILGAEQEGLREVTFEHPSLSSTAARFWVAERLLYPCPDRGESDG